MAYTHVAHDCDVGKMVVMANNATLAGQATIGDFVTLGGLVTVQPFVRVGDYTFVGGKTDAEKDIPPYVIAAGDPIMLRGLNHVGLKRHDFSEPALAALKKSYRILFRYGLPQNQAIERIRAEVALLPEVTHFIEFIETSASGVTQ
jgi:UDP-N-acetylglucosamine acyltransferase